jgi:hypothetical protein
VFHALVSCFCPVRYLLPPNTRVKQPDRSSRLTSRRTPPRTAVLLLAALLPGAPRPASPQTQPQTPPSFDYAGSVGVVSAATGGGLCLAIQNPHLASGIPVVLLWVPIVDGPGPARLLVAQTTSQPTGSCTPDSPFHFKAYGDSLYRLSLLEGEFDPATFYTAVVIAPANVSIRGDSIFARLDPTESPVTFRACTSHEGIHLTVWTGEPLKSSRVWHRYVYLGFDTDARCQKADYEGSE